ncbi:hypothetical protein [Nitrobacter winogradskyi]|uniref:Uncharacterized protein n=2 Tax=Nitrobacter winogradskyi TaxID=913 RepID=A0ACC6ADW6_NITWI|nr:hypothetical protein [Nitrobacter winogradskyi]MCP1997881.1 hypothetical protein [Nitrobacter winogradskyi]GEC17172.1 hypothetical protein NWI01_30640 [Nitrobacter winogradskyi]
MLLHFVVISLFEERYASEARLGPKDPDHAHQRVAQTLGSMGVKAGPAQDPMWYLIREGRKVGYVKVFREERYARNWFRDLAGQESSQNFWAFWRDGQPLALVEGANARDANQFVKSMSLCRVRAFSAESAADTGWKKWISGHLTAEEVFLDRLRDRSAGKVEPPPEAKPTPEPARRKGQAEPSGWQVMHQNIGEGTRPSVELRQNITITGMAPSQPSAVLSVVFKLTSEGLVSDPEAAGSGVRFDRKLSFFLRPFRLPHAAEFVMGLATLDQSRADRFHVLASPVDLETSIIKKFSGSTDVANCVELLRLGKELLFTISDDVETLVKLSLPNDGEFRRLMDEAHERLMQTEITYYYMRQQLRR